MKRALPALIVALLLSTATVTALTDWMLVAERLRDSIVNIETTEADGGEGRCSGFVIDDVRDFVMTAAHCIGGKETFIDSEPAVLKAKDVKNDLAVFYVKGIDHTALTMAVSNPRIGEEVASYGYGWGLERPFFRVAHVSDNKTTIPDLEGGPWVIVDGAYVPGQSGCPVVNAKGEVVAIVQRTSNTTGLGVGVEVIRDKFGKYFTQK